MSLKRAIAGVLTIGFMIASATGLPSASYAQDEKVKTAMDTLRSKAEKLGSAKIEGDGHRFRQGGACHLFRLNQTE